MWRRGESTRRACGSSTGWGCRTCLIQCTDAWLFFLEDEVRGGRAGGEFDPVGEVCGDVDDVAGVEGDLGTALDGCAAGFAGLVGDGVTADDGASGDDGHGAF